MKLLANLFGRLIDWAMTSRGMAVMAVFVIVLAVLGIWLGFVLRDAARLRDLEAQWRATDDYYRQGQFGPANPGYERIHELLAEWEWLERRRPDDRLGTLMRDVCSIGKYLDDNAADLDAAELTQKLDEWNQLYPQFEKLLTEQELEEAPGAGKSDPWGPDVPLDDRWGHLLDWVKIQADAVKNGLLREPCQCAWSGSIVPAADDAATPPAAQPPTAVAEVDRFGAYVDFLARYGRQVDELRDDSKEIRERIAFRALCAEFKLACRAAAADPDERTVLRAFMLWRQMEQRFPDRIDSATIEQFRTELAELLKNSTPQCELDLRPGGGARPTVFPAKEYLALIRDGHSSREATEGPLIFVTLGDCCYALEAETGRPRWVCHVGYDARWLPEWVEHGGEEYVVLAWEHEGREAVTVATAARLKPRWTCQLPDGVALASPPTVAAGRVYLLTETGELWQYGLSSGSVQGTLKLPERVASPMVLREDRQGALVVGRTLGVYLLELGDRPRIVDVVFPNKDPEALIARGMWIPPFAIVFENVLRDECHLIVFHRGPAGYEEVQRDTIGGRLWQAPGVDGALFLVVTDTNTEAIFGLQLSNPKQPLYRPFTNQGPQRMASHVAQFLSQPEAPFVSMFGSALVRFSVDPLRSAGTANWRIRWKHELPHPEYVPTQPLQYNQRGIILAARRPGRSGVRAQCVALEEAQLRWDMEVGSPAAEFLVGHRSENGCARVLVRTQSDGLFALSAYPDGRWASRSLKVAANGSVDWAWRGNFLVWVGDDPPRLRQVSLGGTELGSRLLDAPPASPVAVHEDDDRRWAVFVDTQRRAQLFDIQDQSRQTLFLQLPHGAPAEGWLRPLWSEDGRSVLLAHPDGELIRAELAIEGGVPFLRSAAARSQAGLVGSPVIVGNRLWLNDRDGLCRLLDFQTMKCLAEVRLPATPETGPVVCQRRLLTGLHSGKIAVVDGESPGEPPLEIALSQKPIPFLRAAPQGSAAVAADSTGKLFLIEHGTRHRKLPSASGPVAAPPLICSGGLFVGTTRGSLERIAAAAFSPGE